MKNLLLLGVLCAFGFALKAQTIANNSGCAVSVTVTCYDPSAMPCTVTTLPSFVVPAFTPSMPFVSCAPPLENTFTICRVNCMGTCAIITNLAAPTCFAVPQVAPLLACPAIPPPPPPVCPFTSVDYNPITRIITIR